MGGKAGEKPFVWEPVLDARPARHRPSIPIELKISADMPEDAVMIDAGSAVAIIRGVGPAEAEGAEADQRSLFGRENASPGERWRVEFMVREAPLRRRWRLLTEDEIPTGVIAAFMMHVGAELEIVPWKPRGEVDPRWVWLIMRGDSR